MLTQESAHDKSALDFAAQRQVLAALAAVPLDQTRLFQVVVRSGRRRRSRWSRLWETPEKSAVGFADTLAILQAAGLIRRTAHPLEDRRLYYLTEKGSEVAKGIVSANRRTVLQTHAISPTELVGS
jgi:hypothetical protein